VHIGQYTGVAFVALALLRSGVSAPLATGALGIMQGTGLVARPIWGIVSDRVFRGERCVPFALLCVLGALSLWALARIGPSVPAALVVVAIGLGASTIGFTGLLNTLLAEMGGPDAAAMGVGLTFTYAAGFVTPPIFGAIVDPTGKRRRAKGLWAELGVVSAAGVARKFYAFIAITARSRELYVHFTTDMKLLTWLDCHRRAFAFFGGVPAEVLIDNLKTGVVSRAGSTARFHKQFEAMAVAYGFRPIAHSPRRPKTKGRVERLVRFTRERFFVGRDFADLEQLNLDAERWLRERASRRIHRITRERPEDRFAVEHASLKPLVDYDIVLEEPRVADSYALVSVDGVRYSIPPQYARRHVTLQRRPESITFVVDGSIVAQHPYGKRGQRLVQDPAHLPRRPSRGTTALRSSVIRLQSVLASWGVTTSTRSRPPRRMRRWRSSPRFSIGRKTMASRSSLRRWKVLCSSRSSNAARFRKKRVRRARTPLARRLGACHTAKRL
jgi:Integrase core domain